MSAPPKPWERAGINNQNVNTSLSGQMSSPTVPEPLLPDATRGVSAHTRTPPPVPTRPSQQRSSLGYNSGIGAGGFGYGGAYNGMGYGSYGSSYGGMYGNSYGGFGGYGGGAYGMNRFGMGNNYDQNTFSRQAEESSRQAFQSIESIVHAVGSVSMMLESSFYAVYNSFRAVVGVADHFSRMKMAFAQIFSAFAVIRTLRWLYRKLLVLLRLRPSGHEEEVWSQAAESGVAALADAEFKDSSRSSWPIMLFFTIIIGGPWLIWRLLASITGQKEGKEWYNGYDDHFRAVAEHDFQGDSEEELSFRRGQHITIAPKEYQPRMRGWLLGSVDGKKTGILPANYVKILGRRKGRRHLGKQTTNGAARSVDSSSVSSQATATRASGLPVPYSGGAALAPSSITDMEDTFRNVQHQRTSISPSNDVELGRVEFGDNLDVDGAAAGAFTDAAHTSSAAPQDAFLPPVLSPATADENDVREKTASEILEKSDD